ncbi:hypothetical protein YC2023_094626 [Brassica napus]
MSNSTSNILIWRKLCRVYISIWRKLNRVCCRLTICDHPRVFTDTKGLLFYDELRDTSSSAEITILRKGWASKGFKAIRTEKNQCRGQLQQSMLSPAEGVLGMNYDVKNGLHPMIYSEIQAFTYNN